MSIYAKPFLIFFLSFDRNSVVGVVVHSDTQVIVFSTRYFLSFFIDFLLFC